jgi:stage II sporulation protein R
MRKLTSFFAILCFAVLFSACSSNTTIKEGYETLRIHVISDSYDSIDQAVRDRVVRDVRDYTIRLISGVNSYGEALRKVNANLMQIDGIVSEAIAKSGRAYAGKAKVIGEYFPTRVYGAVVVESGYYQSLTITLGSGEGDNWWCVLYPPLCADENVVYRSRVVEWLTELFGSRPSLYIFWGKI